MNPRLAVLVQFLIAPCLIGGDAPAEKPIEAAERKHWAFQPPVRPAVPSVRRSDWPQNPIDAFILARLEAAGLEPSPPADRRAWLRRITFDLVGLPPTPEELDAFLADSSPQAFEKVVDRLLTSPAYGERWGQHWLDAVRFAESNGYELDADRPHAWRYRDYVVRSLNADKPYDQFLTEQLAGDLLARGQDPRAAADLWIATGMQRCGPIHLVSGNIDPEETRREQLNEYLQGIGAAVLGLTLHCARCHDHKFDPISQGDYYRFEAFFAAARFEEIDLALDSERAAYKAEIARIDQQIAPLKKEVAAIDQPIRKRLHDDKLARLEAPYREALATEPAKRTKEQQQLVKDAEPLLKVSWDEIVAALTPEQKARRTALRAQIHELEARKPPPPPKAWAIAESDSVPPTHILKRGEYKKKGPVVHPAFPRVLTPGSPGSQSDSARLSRLDLARWITRPDHPLTARVIVNRLWQHYFGHGLVRTPTDFGTHGEAPTHPELLDWLASELAASGWRLKPIHRLIALSAAYRQRSDVPVHPKDPDNRLLGRMNRKRLEGEAIRDAILAVSGSLTLQLGGPSIRIPLEPEVYDQIFTEGEPDGLWLVTPDVTQHTRRSLYLFAKRNVRLPIFEAFDQPDRILPCGERAVSTFAPQALILLNGPLSRTQARVFATQLMHRAGLQVDRQIRFAYLRALGRLPQPDEVSMIERFLSDQAELIRERLLARKLVDVPEPLPPGADPAHAAALAEFCLALFNANEFVYRP